MTGNGTGGEDHQRTPSSYLFVPANRPDRFEKAAASGAHRIILDLEDAVSPADKDTARAAVINWFKAGKSGIVRINSADSFWFDADLAAVANCQNAEVMVPKASSVTLEYVHRFLIDRSLIALVETVAGLVQIMEIAGTKGVSRLAFGNLDFSSDARLPVASAALDQARFQIAMASRHAGLPLPIDGVTANLNDEALLEADIDRARDFGFGGKMCIHPKQVSVVNMRFGPSSAEIDWANAVLQAIQKGGGGVIQFEGRMIDKPVVERARYLLAQQSALGCGLQE